MMAAATVQTAAPGTRSRHLKGKSSSSLGVTRKNPNSSTSSPAPAAIANPIAQVTIR